MHFTNKWFVNFVIGNMSYSISGETFQVKKSSQSKKIIKRLKKEKKEENAEKKLAEKAGPSPRKVMYLSP